MKTLFVGNRIHALPVILEKLDSEPLIAVHADSYGHNGVRNREFHTRTFRNREELKEIILSLEFQILISEGCPFILPVSQMKRAGQLYVNLHPAILPDHRGPIPVISAMYSGRNAGATCHVMTDKVDVGPILAQVPIHLHPGINLELLYHLCFQAEAIALSRAIDNGFAAIPDLAVRPYREAVFTNADAASLAEVDLNMPVAEIAARARALSIGRRHAAIIIEGKARRIARADILDFADMMTLYPSSRPGTLVQDFGNMLLVRTVDGFLKLELIQQR